MEVYVDKSGILMQIIPFRGDMGIGKGRVSN